MTTAIAETRRDLARQTVRQIAVGGLAGLVAGILVAGVGGRVVMRLMSLLARDEVIGLRTENGNTIGTVTREGTIGLIVFLGIFGGLIGGFLLVVTWPWFEVLGKWAGVTLGTFAFAVGSSVILDPHNIDFPILGNQLFAVVLFSSLFFVWAFAAVWLRGWFERRFARSPSKWDAAFVAIALLGLPVVLLIVETALGVNPDGAIPSRVGIGILAIGAATLISWTNAILGGTQRLRRVAQVVAYIAIGVILATGLLTALQNATDIVR